VRGLGNIQGRFAGTGLQRPRALLPVAPVDPPGSVRREQSAPLHPPVTAKKVGDSLQLALELLPIHNNRLADNVGQQYRSAIDAYLSLHSNEKRERVSDLLGIDEYA
jgi:hypothetical protein